MADIIPHWENPPMVYRQSPINFEGRFRYIAEQVIVTGVIVIPALRNSAGTATNNLVLQSFARRTSSGASWTGIPTIMGPQWTGAPAIMAPLSSSNPDLLRFQINAIPASAASTAQSFPGGTSYELRLTFKDNTNTSQSVHLVPKGTVSLHLDDNGGVGIGAAMNSMGGVPGGANPILQVAGTIYSSGAHLGASAPSNAESPSGNPDDFTLNGTYYLSGYSSSPQGMPTSQLYLQHARISGTPAVTTPYTQRLWAASDPSNVWSRSKVSASWSEWKPESNYLTLTNAQRLALPAGARYEGLRVWVTDQQLDYIYYGSAWRVAPGQVLASMTGPATNTTGAAGTLVGSIVSTPVLASGTTVKVIANFSQYNQGAAGISNVSINARNASANVTYTTYDSQTNSRAYSPSSAGVVSGSGANFLLTLTATQKVSAAIYLGSATSCVYGADMTSLRIESA